MKSYFLDNEEYGAADVNAVVSTLATGGVIVELTNENFNTPESLAALAGTLATPGVTDFDTTGLRVYVNDGIYTVTPGKAIMPDGCVVVIDEAEVIEVPEDTAGYVYLKYDTFKCTHGFLFSMAEDEDNALILAAVGEDGAVTDMRIFSQTRLVPNSKNITQMFTFEGECSETVDTGYVGWNGLMIMSKYEAFEEVRGDVEYEFYGCRNFITGDYVYDITDWDSSRSYPKDRGNGFHGNSDSRGFSSNNGSANVNVSGVLTVNNKRGIMTIVLF